jgi:ribonuclease HI
VIVPMLFTDGGCIGRNPSIHGGTWAYIILNAHTTPRTLAVPATPPNPRIKSGVVWPKGGKIIESAEFEEIEQSFFDRPYVTSNLTEFYAALTGIHELYRRDYRKIQLFTDSEVTASRLTGEKAAMKGLPANLVNHWREIQSSLALDILLLQGHPTKIELEAGVGKSGRVVSVWNKHCDTECRRLANLARHHWKGVEK